MDCHLLRPIIALLTVALFVQIARAQTSPATQTPRQTSTINPFWKFQLGDLSDAAATSFDDSSWQPISLPHSFSLPSFMSADFYTGYGWYRKSLQLPASLENKQLALEFDGVFQDAEIYLNGTRVGAHKGGYTGFSIDISQAAKPGDNTLAVRVNNLWNPRLAPRAGEHTFSGGIYRNVRLVITNPLHVAWCGTSVTTPQVSSESATVAVQTQVANDADQPAPATLQHQILDPEGTLVAEFSTYQTIPAHSSVLFDATSPAIKSPRLWHPDHPFLYSLKTTVSSNSIPTDQVSTPFSIRSIRWTADQGFFINGEHLYLRGANVHQDQAGWGDAVTDADLARDVKLIKDAGFNFIRGSHYPHAPAFVEACDRLGILFWSENAFWGIGGFRPDGYWNSSAYPPNPQDQPEFEASVKQQLSEMIRIHRNHPAIIAWSMSNEPFFSDQALLPKVRAFLADLVKLSRSLDPTRPAAIGGAQRPLDQNRIHNVGDLAGYNGDGATIPLFQNPGFPSVVTEYSSVTANRPGAYAPGWASLSKDNGEPVYPWRSGQAVWCGFDHASIAGPNLGKMGIIDYFRIPKRAWFWYRNAYAHVPPPAWPQGGTPARLRLEADKSTAIRTDGTDSAHLLITVLDAQGTPLSNSPRVDLAVLKGPGEFPTGPSITFEEHSDIRIQDGQAAITIRSPFAGETVVRASSPGLPPADLTLQFVGPVPFEPGKTLPVRPRPYVRFARKAQPAKPQTFGQNNPSFASTSLPDHPSGAATDGDPATWWQPANDDPAPSWVLDTEKSLLLSRFTLSFAKASRVRFILEASNDRATWNQVVDFSKNDKVAASFEEPLPPKTLARFVRIRFMDPTPENPVQLSEFRVTGTLGTQ